MFTLANLLRLSVAAIVVTICATLFALISALQAEDATPYSHSRPIESGATQAVNSPAAAVNPFGLAPVVDPDGLDVREFASSVKLTGDAGDQNAEQWVNAATSATEGALDGEWFGRWRNGIGTAKIVTTKDRVHIFYREWDEAYKGQVTLVEALRQENGLFVGRWVQDHDRDVSGPFVGLAVGDDRIDGVWGDGARWDFRRKLATDVPSMRTWTDRAGKRTIEAQLLGSDGERFRLRLANGKVATVRMEQVSQKDEDFVRESLGKRVLPAGAIDSRSVATSAADLPARRLTRTPAERTPRAEYAATPRRNYTQYASPANGTYSMQQAYLQANADYHRAMAARARRDEAQTRAQIDQMQGEIMNRELYNYRQRLNNVAPGFQPFPY